MPSVGATIYKGKFLSQARQALLAEGWTPEETFGVDSNGKRSASIRMGNVLVSLLMPETYTKGVSLRLRLVRGRDVTSATLTTFGERSAYR